MLTAEEIAGITIFTGLSVDACDRLARVAAERVERGEANVDAAVAAERAHQRGLHLRIEMILAVAPADALQAFAGGLLLEHGERDELAHAGDFGV